MSTLKRAIEIGRRGYPEKACAILRDMVQSNPDDIYAWLWLAEYSPDPEEASRAANRILQMRPTHVRAREILDTIEGPVSFMPGEVIVVDKPKRGEQNVPQNPDDRWMLGLMVLLLLLLVAAIVLVFFGLALGVNEVAFWVLNF